MKKEKLGFSLVEVLISIFITAIALLGLAMMEVNILRSSQSSFNYTVATIRANSVIDAIWMDLCNAQSSSAVYTQIRSTWIDELTSAGMTTLDNAPPATFSQVMPVTINWTDPRFNDDDANNKLTLNVKFPDSGC